METHRLKIDELSAKPRAQFSATLWRGSATALELGIFSGGVVRGLGDVSSITLRVRSARLAIPLLLEKVVAAADFTACTAPQWAAGTHEHLRLEMTSEEMNFTLVQPPSTLHVTVSALLGSGGSQILGYGEFVMHDAGAVPGETLPTTGTLLTLEEADARYLQISGLSWLVGATKADGKITLADGSAIFLEAPAP